MKIRNIEGNKMTSWKNVGIYPRRKAEMATMILSDQGMHARIGNVLKGRKSYVYVAKSNIGKAKKYMQKQDWPKILKRDREYWDQYFKKHNF